MAMSKRLLIAAHICKMSKRLLNSEEVFVLNCIFSASLMCMDFMSIRESLDILEQNCSMLHVDIMDGHFCSNLALSPGFIRAVRPNTKLGIEAHLMISRPEELLEELASAGTDLISLHAETINTSAFRIIRKVKELGCKVGIVLNPATPLEYVGPYLEQADVLTIMTVDVGYAGQPFIPEMLAKIRQAEQLRREHGYKYIIQSDGANNKRTYRALYEAGVRSFVMGSTGLFGLSTKLEEACMMMRNEFEQALRKE